MGLGGAGEGARPAGPGLRVEAVPAGPVATASAAGFDVSQAGRSGSGLTTSTGAAERRSTSSVVLPKSRRLAPVSP